MMRTALQMLPCFALAVAASCADLSGSWLERGVVWTKAPATIDHDLRSGRAEVVNFASDGEFAILTCTLYRRKSGVTVSAGDPQDVDLGRWQSIGSSLHIQHRLSFRTIERSGETLPGPEISGVVEIMNDHTIRFRGKVFRRERSLDKGVEEDLVGVRSVAKR
jgi:hypothetical protein